MRMWANERERFRDREVGGEGVKTYDTQGGGGACESLEDAERREGMKLGKKKKEKWWRIEWQGLLVFLLLQ